MNAASPSATRQPGSGGLVIPPDTSGVGKQDFLGMVSVEISDEDGTIQRRADHGHSETGGGRRARVRALPRARVERRQFLQMAGEVWRHRCVDDRRDLGSGGAEPAAEEDVRRDEHAE